MRIEKVNELIKQELGKILLENIEFEPGVLVTIQAVDTSKTLENAKVWISIFPEGKENYVLNLLYKEIGLIQRVLNKTLNLKFVPKIDFKIDKSENYVSNIDKVFEEIEKEE